MTYYWKQRWWKHFSVERAHESL